MVIECFAKMTNHLDQSKEMSVRENDAKPILKAARGSSDPKVVKNA